MLTTIMKYVAITTLLAGLFWQFVPSAKTYLDFLVTAGAVFVLVQAISLRKYWWVVGFSAITLLFSPIRPLEFSFGTMVVLQILTAAVFAVSLQLLKTSPRLTSASITEVNPRMESL